MQKQWLPQTRSNTWSPWRCLEKRKHVTVKLCHSDAPINSCGTLLRGAVAKHFRRTGWPRESYSQHRHVRASASSAIVSRNESAGIPHRKNHIGSVRVNADGSLANKLETVKQLSMLSKVPASMARTASLVASALSWISIWPMPPYMSTIPCPHIGDLHKPSRKTKQGALHWDLDAFLSGYTKRPKNAKFDYDQSQHQNNASRCCSQMAISFSSNVS